MTQTDFPAARRAMIDSQLRTSGINTPFVLERMGAVGREAFLPASQHAAAYIDRAVTLADGGALAAPAVYGALLAEAQPVAGDRALVVENGSGYLAELVGPLVGSLDTVAAGALATGTLPGTGYTLILVDGAAEQLPESLAGALAEGGRVVTGLLERGVTRLATGRKSGAGIALLPLAEMGIPRIAAFAAPKAWSF